MREPTSDSQPPGPGGNTLMSLKPPGLGCLSVPEHTNGPALPERDIWQVVMTQFTPSIWGFGSLGLKETQISRS